MSTVQVTVAPQQDAQRADKVLAELLDLSRSSVRTIIDVGGATIDGVAVKPSQKMRSGIRVSVVLPELVLDLVADPSVPFEVVFEDASILVVDKPCGVVVHPGSGRDGGTLVNGLIDRYPDIVGVGQTGRWGIVHRLDRDTSGLLVVARTAETYDRLVAMMKEREIARRYLSVVHGTFTNTIGTIDAPIGRDPSNPTRMHVDRLGRPATTHYRTLARWSVRDATLLSVTLDTGRTHQIRVHLGSIRHKVLGDGVYGKRGVVGDPGRTWLHARQLAFDHPRTGEAITFTSSLPADLSASLANLGAPDLGSVCDVDGETL